MDEVIYKQPSYPERPASGNRVVFDVKHYRERSRSREDVDGDDQLEATDGMVCHNEALINK